jgi:hydrogenase maturation factor
VALPVGKVSWSLLERLLREHCRVDRRVVVGPRVGEDSAVVDMGETCLVAATDPITFASDAIGYYAVQVNANDVATMGAGPRWFLATLLLPERDTTAELVKELFRQIGMSCDQLGVSLIGGHTEITAGLDRPIVVGTMLGEVNRDGLVTSSGARPGDVVILTKGIAVEGTALLARERETSLKPIFDSEFIERCKNFLYKPGISVLSDALAAREASRAHAMHDPTEGGLATGLWELATASGVKLTVDREAISILPETKRLCRQFGLDPLGLIASGALLIVVRHEDGQKVCEALRQRGIAATVIASVAEGSGVYWRDGSMMLRFERDELARLFDQL